MTFKVGNKPGRTSGNVTLNRGGEVTADDFRRRVALGEFASKPVNQRPPRKDAINQGRGASVLFSDSDLEQFENTPPGASQDDEHFIPGNPLDDTPVEYNEEETHEVTLGHLTISTPTAHEDIKRYMPPPLAGASSEIVSTRQGLVKHLSPSIPKTENGFPRFFYRADLLDHYRVQSFLVGLETEIASARQYQTPLLTTTAAPRAGRGIQDMLDAATVHLEYDEGFPALPSGQPFWGKLPYETDAAYLAFAEKYLEIDGIRTHTDPSLDSYPPELLKEWFHCNYWSLRAEAYDTFRIAHYNKLRVARVTSMEDRHYRDAEKLYMKIMTALGSEQGQAAMMALAGTEPDKALKMLQMTAQMQRVALGLPANGSLPEEQRRVQSVEVALRSAQIDRSRDVSDQGLDPELFSDEKTLGMAQELILRVQSK